MTLAIIILLFLGALAALFLVLCLVSGFSCNGKPMRVPPKDGNTGLDSPKALSWFIEGRAGETKRPFSCSFVEFDERGDFLDFQQHRDCQRRINDLVNHGEKVLLVTYTHGWKNSSQSGDVVKFNSFLGRIAASTEVVNAGLRVHGVYLGWRGNIVRPFVDKSGNDEAYEQTKAEFGEPIVDAIHHRPKKGTGFLPENLSYWNRKSVAEHKASGLPIARAIFSYAVAAKGYGKIPENKVFVIGHSFGALMLEQSLGQAMTSALTLQWWKSGDQKGVPLPFDMVLFVNSAAPAIYAKETRDFLSAHRAAQALRRDPEQDAPVIISITSEADWATGVTHRIGNILAPLSPSLSRRYTSGIFGNGKRDEKPEHRAIRQSVFYTRTVGHHPYLINHWIVKDLAATVDINTDHATAFAANLRSIPDPERFITSEQQHPATCWKLVDEPPPGREVLVDGRKPAMQNSSYWIIQCSKEIIADHGDVWSRTAMEVYVGMFRLAVSLRGKKGDPTLPDNAEEKPVIG